MAYDNNIKIIIILIKIIIIIIKVIIIIKIIIIIIIKIIIIVISKNVPQKSCFVKKFNYHMERTYRLLKLME